LEGALPRIYKGEWSILPAKWVSAYRIQEPSEETTPVQRWSGDSPNDVNGKYVDTGVNIVVHLRNGYRDDEILYYPRQTLWILGATIASYALAVLLTRAGTRIARQR
jgi:hypothetical protein